MNRRPGTGVLFRTGVPRYLLGFWLPKSFDTMNRRFFVASNRIEPEIAVLFESPRSTQCCDEYWLASNRYDTRSVIGPVLSMAAWYVVNRPTENAASFRRCEGSGRRGTTLTAPPIAPEPYSTDAGPYSTPM